MPASTYDMPMRHPAIHAFASHWRIYLMEAALLGGFMLSACGFGALLEHPGSPVREAIDSAFLRRVLMGLAMGVTAIGLIYSNWGKRSGAHMNPAVTLSFLRLRRINPWDALFYISFQCAGGLLGVLTAVALLPGVREPHVNFVVTVPSRPDYFPAAAWAGEFIIAFGMMFMILTVNRRPRLAPYTGCFAGLLLVLYISFEAPFSGMSLNPARTLASAVPAGQWLGWWIYLTAPLLGMFAAIELVAALRRGKHTLCGKFSHSRRVSCIFKCDCIHASDHPPS